LFEEITNACLGYAIVNLCSENDLGRGPFIYANKKDIDQDKVWKLRIMHAQTTLNHYSNNPKEHISLLIKREVMDTKHLTQNINEDNYPRIKWTSAILDTTNDVAKILDGKHRAAMAQELCQNFINKFKRSGNDHFVSEALMAYGGRVPELYTLAVDIKREVMEKQGNWYCAIYDWGQSVLKNCVYLVTNVFYHIRHD
jgi:hypothetical protein